jgi:hypothetical protein
LVSSRPQASKQASKHANKQKKTGRNKLGWVDRVRELDGGAREIVCKRRCFAVGLGHVCVKPRQGISARREQRVQRINQHRLGGGQQLAQNLQEQKPVRQQRKKQVKTTGKSGGNKWDRMVVHERLLIMGGLALIRL